jgi:hypothetical protein
MSESFPSFESIEPPSDNSQVEGVSSVGNSAEIKRQEKISASEKASRVAKTVRSKTSTIIRTRSDLKKHLAQFGINLITSAVMFHKTSSFIFSSKVIYLKHGDKSEKLISFLTRYPQFKESVNAIEVQLKALGTKNMGFSDDL